MDGKGSFVYSGEALYFVFRYFDAYHAVVRFIPTRTAGQMLSSALRKHFASCQFVLHDQTETHDTTHASKRRNEHLQALIGAQALQSSTDLDFTSCFIFRHLASLFSLVHFPRYPYLALCLVSALLLCSSSSTWW